MKMEARFRVELCSPRADDTRPALSYVNITEWQGQPVAMAADGFMLAVVPVELEEGDVPGLVHWSAFPHARKAGPKGMVRMLLGETEVRFADGWSAPRIVHTGPKHQNLKFPDINSIVTRTEPVDISPVFALNPRLLVAVSEAIGTAKYGATVLHRDRDSGPILVGPRAFEALPEPPFAVVMPMHLARRQSADSKKQAAA